MTFINVLWAVCMLRFHQYKNHTSREFFLHTGPLKQGQMEGVQRYLSGIVALLAPPGLVRRTWTTGSAAGAGVTGDCTGVR